MSVNLSWPPWDHDNHLVASQHVIGTHLIGLDWGTTALRAYRFDHHGRAIESRYLPSGVMRIVTQGGADAAFAQAVSQACGDWLADAPAAPVIACGMIGSAQGWREAPYREVPIELDALGHALTAIDTGSGRLHVIPGLVARGALPDVLR